MGSRIVGTRVTQLDRNGICGPILAELPAVACDQACTMDQSLSCWEETKSDVTPKRGGAFCTGVEIRSRQCGLSKIMLNFWCKRCRLRSRAVRRGNEFGGCSSYSTVLLYLCDINLSQDVMLSRERKSRIIQRMAEIINFLERMCVTRQQLLPDHAILPSSVLCFQTDRQGVDSMVLHKFFMSKKQIGKQRTRQNGRTVLFEGYQYTYC